MKDFAGKTAVVTGAGSGIGKATAEALAAKGCRVAVTDIDSSSAQATVDGIVVGGGDAAAFRLDVRDTVEIHRVAVEISESMGIPAVLVNNAGIAIGSYFPDTSEEHWERIIDINLMGVVHCCRVFLPGMMAAGNGGHVVNIASMLGYTPARGVTAYCTTKYGVLGFSESLRAELCDHDIGVSAICPGIINTNIIASGTLVLPDGDIDEKRKTIEALYRKRNYSPERVAGAIVKAIHRNRAVVPVAPEAWLAYYLKRWTPWLVHRIARRDVV